MVPDAAPSLLEGWSAKVWANVYGSGNFSAGHSHPGSIWAGVYFVDPGVEPGAAATGAIVFEDHMGLPRVVAGGRDPVARAFTVVPEPGLMVVFPGMLWHHVEPYRGQRERVTVAFNLKHPAFVSPGAPPSELKERLWRDFPGLMRPAARLKHAAELKLRRARRMARRN
jgi:Putative 2OG-Fe(II) oxygenase